MLLDKLLAAPKADQSEEKAVSPRNARPPSPANSQSPDDLLNEGVEAVLYLLNHRYIDREMADRLLSGMLSGYVARIVQQEVTAAIGDPTTAELAQPGKGRNG